MSTERDPLLPQNAPAPEISLYGARPAITQQPDVQEPVEESQVPDANTGKPWFDRVLSVVSIAVALGVFIVLVWPDALRSIGKDLGRELSIKERVDQIVSKTPLIDGHNDLAILLRAFYGNAIYGKKFTDAFENGGLIGHVDLPRLREGKLGGSFWSAFVSCPENGTDFSDGNYAEAVSTTLSQIDVIRRLIESYPTRFSLPTADLTSALANFKDSGELISPIGIEGLHQIGNSYANLRLYESLGARYTTLTHNCHNKYADAALIEEPGRLTKAPPYWGGVSKDGQELIQEMNRIGMIVDLSHVSQNTMRDVLGGYPDKWNGSAAPVMFSHSSAYALCPHPRNVPDDVLKLVKKTNSIVMVNFAPHFISCIPSNSSSGIPDQYPANSTLHQVAKHVVYIGKLIGYDHVGFGSDFDGIPETPRGLGDVSRYPALVAELLELGVTDEEAAKIVGQNILRVWRDANTTAKKLQKAGVKPAEDKVERRF